ncbi:hypothetical protein SAMN06265379_101847 [Saccharicrinis carchari]|uniref:Virus attachment protein p12 family protein n=1 Tax=Saccharicrinis carchari TaxID=1168039 RepID=A0A521BBH6_SACCC|nr:FeoB-associated Cys-rich membrane protein [Saccharicrinis carchari]SMO44419.1 hypothetical protein SAMN06265379_101847 [Saccharicrinis carchari]
MVQEILMWTCVVGAFGYTAYSFGKAIWEAYQPNVTNGCGSSCGGCGPKSDLMKQVKKNQIRPLKLSNTER